jgi:hypothetical protein
MEYSRYQILDLKKQSCNYTAFTGPMGFGIRIYNGEIAPFFSITNIQCGTFVIGLLAVFSREPLILRRVFA